MKPSPRILVLAERPDGFQRVQRHLSELGPASECHRVADPTELAPALDRGGWSAVLAEYPATIVEPENLLAQLAARNEDPPLILLLCRSIAEAEAGRLLDRGVTALLPYDPLDRLTPTLQCALTDAEHRRVRRDLEAALRSSEKLWIAVFDSTPLIAVVLDRDGTIVAANAAWNRMASASPLQDGSPPRHCEVGSNYLEVCRHSRGAEADLARQAHDGIRAVIERRLPGFELEYACHSPTAQRWFAMAVTPLAPLPGGVLVTHREITDRTRMEAWARLQESRLRLALEAAEMVTWELEVDTGRLNYSTNLPALAGSTNLERYETLERFLDQLHPQDRENAEAAIERTIETGVPFEAEYRVLLPDGTWHWLAGKGRPRRDDQGRVSRVIGVSQDITRRKRSEEALRESEFRHDLALDAARLGTWEWDLVADRHRWSTMQEALWGFAPGAFPGTTEAFIERIHPEDRSALWEAGEPARTTGGPFRAEFRVVLPDGRVRWIVSRGQFLSDDRGRPTRVLGVTFDNTDRKHLESQLRQAQKLEAVGQLAGGVAHDFNNILAAMMLQLGLLETQPDLDSEARQAVADLSGEARRAATLTRQLLMFSRRSVLDIHPLKLDEVVTHLLGMLRRLIGEHIQLRFEGHPGILPPVEADAGMLEQAIVNLVVNARDALPKGGHITLATSVESVTDSADAGNPARRPGRFVRLTVSDDGIGMDEETLKHVFEPFFTTKEPGKGTGLGLATVHGIVAQHGGWVEAESQAGRGTIFRLFFPAREAPPACTEGGTPTSGPLKRGRETILVVEDEASVRLGLRRAFAALGYRVLEAENGPQALTLWTNHAGEVDLLFTDMVMPEGLTGLELAERLMASKPGLRVIISSGYSHEIHKSGGLHHAGICYLPKPYTTRTLAEVLRTCLDCRPTLGDPGAGGR